MKFKKFQKAFTLVEIIIVIGIVTTLLSLITVNLIKPQTQATFPYSVNVLATDIKSQQLKAMTGDTLGQSTSQEHGIYFETGKYTLFKGSTYSAIDPDNFIVNLESGVTLSGITFPTSQIVFAKRSGDVLNFAIGSNTVSVNNAQNGESKTLTIQRYGAVIIN